MVKGCPARAVLRCLCPVMAHRLRAHGILQAALRHASLHSVSATAAVQWWIVTVQKPPAGPVAVFASFAALSSRRRT